jgi:purine nucleosidase/pyrimidine-specific ribonucleoside hydrolase
MTGFRGNSQDGGALKGLAPRVPHRVIIDTDPGVDDALAILLALRSPELEVVGISTVCGNVPVDRATGNLYRTLALLNHSSKVLIGQGAARPLARALHTADDVHGADGLGELDRFHGSDGTPRYPAPAVPTNLPSALTVWRECLARYPSELTLITLGPLTNLAQALAVAAPLLAGLRRVIVMGGAVTVPGNVTPYAEFNVFVDPDAAELVFESDLPITLVPLDVTTRVVSSRAEIEARTKDSSDPLCRFLGDATGPALTFMERTTGRPVFEWHDPLAVATAIDPTLIRTSPRVVTVETKDPVAMGKTTGRVADRSAPAQSDVALEVDVDRAHALFRSRLCPA